MLSTQLIHSEDETIAHDCSTNTAFYVLSNVFMFITLRNLDGNVGRFGKSDQDEIDGGAGG